MKSILGLLEGQAPGTVEDLSRDLLASMGRQAVHRHSPGACQFE
jgi:hypothetical protein